MSERSGKIQPPSNDQKINEEEKKLRLSTMGESIADANTIVASNIDWEKDFVYDTDAEASTEGLTGNNTSDSYNGIEEGHSYGTRRQKSKPVSPSVLPAIKKSKRQAERMARKLLATQQQQQQQQQHDSDEHDTEENKYNNDCNQIQSKQRSKQAWKTTSHIPNNDSRDSKRAKPPLSVTDPVATTIETSSVVGASAKMVSPASPLRASPGNDDKGSTQLVPAASAIGTTTASSGKKRDESKPSSRIETYLEQDRPLGKSEVRNHPPNDAINAHLPTTAAAARTKRCKLVYRATADPAQPIHRYALDIISLVCNNAYCVGRNRNVQHHPHLPSWHPQPHRVLDRPAGGYTPDTEPPRERLMRLQLRQRFASASSVEMSPIEFSQKLLALWGGSLEQVYHDTNTNTNMNQYNNASTQSVPGFPLTPSRSPMNQGERSRVQGTCSVRDPDNELSYDPNNLEPNPIPEIFRKDFEPIPFRDTGVDNLEPIPIHHLDTNETPKTRHPHQNLNSSSHPTPKKKLKRKPRKPTKALRADSHLLPDGYIPSNSDFAGSSTPGSKKNGPPRKNGRKVMDDSSLPVLYRDLRLAHHEDQQHLNELHCFVRSELLEVYVLQTKNLEDGSTPFSDNIVGIRCTQCGHLPRPQRGGGQTMASFFPKSIDEIYRGVCTWQRIHFPGCQHMPEHYREEYKMRKQSDLTRGKKAHWIKSAYDLGLRNINEERSGITYNPCSPAPGLPDCDQPCRKKPKKTNKVSAKAASAKAASAKAASVTDSAVNNDGSGQKFVGERLLSGEGNLNHRNDDGHIHCKNDTQRRHRSRDHPQPGETADVSGTVVASDDEHDFQLFDFEQNTAAQNK